MSATRSFFALSLFTATAAFAAWTQDGAGSLTFDAKGPAGFKIHGVSPKLAAADDGKNLKVEVKLEDVDTDNGLRNKHMLEDMHAKDFPMVTLTVPTASLKESGGPVETTGTLELNGQKKETKFTYTPRCTGNTCDIEGTAAINLTDFGIKIRSYLGVTVKPDITVGAKFKVVKK
jgi:polyisoprenoid-binding protein YceI